MPRYLARLYSPGEPEDLCTFRVETDSPDEARREILENAANMFGGDESDYEVELEREGDA